MQLRSFRWSFPALLCAGLSAPLTLALASPPGDSAAAPQGETAPTFSALPACAEKGVAWLVKAQHPDGGWGAGSHARQDLKDPHEVQTDPATTAFTTMALLRIGHTPVSGEHKEVVRRAVQHLVRVIEQAKDDGPRVTELQGTQIQTKLGPLVDTAMTAQCLGRVLRLLPQDDPLKNPVDAALEKCVAKLQRGQAQNGSWGGGGWAPVLQSSLATSALEVAQAAGKEVDRDRLEKAREYQKGNFDAGSGRAKGDDGAGIELYGLAGAQRAAAGEAEAARELVRKAKAEGKLAADAPVNETTLRQAGAAPEAAQRLAEANDQNQAQLRRLDDEQLLAGFGNNGGEEYLSYTLTSEALVIAGGEPWFKWREKMEQRVAKVQNPDGSWSGHHCITSPVFCTAAVLQCLTADRDAELLRQIARDVQQQVAQPDAGR